ncbi:MAG: site-2 protease family protein, partial [Betaproteobacteria bacterium]|nr:site-2 protease family protein [Betaproteobacteria bacterium]
MDASLLQKITVYAIPTILAITLHEAAHAYVARWCGDHTAYMLGRITLNPLKHIDPIWTVLVPLGLLLVGSPFIFGAAKPVPVNFGALRHPKRDMIWVAAAGPAANLIMAILWALTAKIALTLPPSGPSEFLALMGIAGIFVNLLLMLFNLLPILPLDGGRIVAGLLPGRLSYSYSRLEPYGMIILIALLVINANTGLLDSLLGPVLNSSLKAVYSTFG